MLIMSFMLGEAGISCLEMPGEAMNLNMLCSLCNKLYTWSASDTLNAPDRTISLYFK
jgi:hypothetical protein